jgi:hypothetical protein
MYVKMVMVMVTVSDINRNLSGKWYGYCNSTCSAWLSYEGCTEEEEDKISRIVLKVKLNYVNVRLFDTLSLQIIY